MQELLAASVILLKLRCISTAPLTFFPKDCRSFGPPAPIRQLVNFTKSILIDPPFPTFAITFAKQHLPILQPTASLIRQHIKPLS